MGRSAFTLSRASGLLLTCSLRGRSASCQGVSISRRSPSMSRERRRFLQDMGALSAAALATSYSATSFGFAANETLNIGCIGTGGRCRTLMKSLVKIPGVKITAVCDVWDAALAEGKKLADPKAFATKDH